MRNNTGKVSFLEGYSAKNPSELRIIRRWINSNYNEQLSVPIGIDNNNDKIYNFEVHKKSANGAVVGSCGSGKTVFLKTWLLSLAVNYPPNRVQFLIIERDYGELSVFEPLPHCVGHAMITGFGSNGHRIAKAIEKELDRRKQALDEMQQNRVVNRQILSELIIVVDTSDLRFLRYYEEDLYRQLCEAARLAHALGIHIFFTCQDAILLNDNDVDGIRLDYLCCFRMPTVEESRRLIGSEDAVSINSGKAFMKTANSIDKVDVFISSSRNTDRGISEAQLSEAEEIVKHICELCVANNIDFANKIILPPLPEEIPLKSVLDGDYSSLGKWLREKVCIGITDNILTQSYDTLTLDCKNMGHTLILGDNGCGKTMFTYTAITAICLALSPDELQIVYIGNSRQELDAIKEFPQVYLVSEIGNIEEIKNCVNFITQLADKNGGEGQRQSKRAVLFIDDLDVLLKKSIEFCDIFTKLITQKSNQIIVIATANPSKTFPRQYFFMSQMDTPFCLHLPSKYEYTEVVGKPDHDIMHTPGRGLVKGAPPVEFQTLSLPLSDHKTPLEALRYYVELAKKRWPMSKEKTHDYIQSNLIRYALDAVFCIDASSSMFLGLQKLKNGIDAICKKFIEEFESRGKELSSFRVRFVVFRDYLTDGNEALLATDFVDLVNDEIDLKSMLNDIKSLGGISPTRSGLEALAFAMRSNWLAKGSSKNINTRYRHVIVAISDSGTRELWECRNVSNYPQRMPSTFEELTALWRMMPPASMMYIAAPNNSGWRRISDEWEGIVHHTITTVGCRELDYSEIPSVVCTCFEL